MSNVNKKKETNVHLKVPSKIYFTKSTALDPASFYSNIHIKSIAKYILFKLHSFTE